MSVCDKTTRLIAEAMGRDLERDEAQFLKEHAAACPECREHLTAAGAVTGMLRGLVPAEADTPLGFGDRLRDKLMDRSGRRGWYGYLPQIRFRPLELGLLAGLLLCALATVGFFYFNEEHPQPILMTAKEVSTETPLSIDLEYLAVRPIGEVAVTIALDEGVKFHSDYAEVAAARTHTWTGKFTEGMNSIPFMVTVEKPGVWQITTRADFDGWRHEHLITLTSTGKMVTMAMYQLPKRRNLTMRSLIFLMLLAATALLFADGGGVTSRVRIKADDSNRNWEQTFFGERLRTMTKNGETPDDLLTNDADQPAKLDPSAGKNVVLKGKRKIEYHIIQEESEAGQGSRKVNKRVIIEHDKPDAPAPKK